MEILADVAVAALCAAGKATDQTDKFGSVIEDLSGAHTASLSSREIPASGVLSQLQPTGPLGDHPEKQPQSIAERDVAKDKSDFVENPAQNNVNNQDVTAPDAPLSPPGPVNEPNDVQPDEVLGESEPVQSESIALDKPKRQRKKKEPEDYDTITGSCSTSPRAKAKSPSRSPARASAHSPSRASTSSPGRGSEVSPGRAGNSSPRRAGNASPGRADTSSPRAGPRSKSNNSPARNKKAESVEVNVAKDNDATVDAASDLPKKKGKPAAKTSTKKKTESKAPKKAAKRKIASGDAKQFEDPAVDKPNDMVESQSEQISDEPRAKKKKKSANVTLKEPKKVGNDVKDKSKSTPKVAKEKKSKPKGKTKDSKGKDQGTSGESGSAVDMVEGSEDSEKPTDSGDSSKSKLSEESFESNSSEIATTSASDPKSEAIKTKPPPKKRTKSPKGNKKVAKKPPQPTDKADTDIENQFVEQPQTTTKSHPKAKKSKKTTKKEVGDLKKPELSVQTVVENEDDAAGSAKLEEHETTENVDEGLQKDGVSDKSETKSDEATSISEGQPGEGDEEDSANRRFQCPQCSYRAKKKVSLRRHMTVHGVFQCAHCDYTAEKVAEYEDHMKVQHPSRCGRKLCKKCNVLFKTDEIEEHEKVCDGEKKKWPCPECGKEFKFLCAMRAHVEKWHSNSVVSCEKCDFETKSVFSLKKHDLKVHQKVVVVKEKVSIECTECGKVFSSGSSIKQHMKLHAGVDHPCPECGKIFKTPSSLQNHIKVHDTTRVVNCEVEGCTKQFKNQKVMEIHRKRCHDKEPKKFKCTHAGCEQQFYTKYHLKRHEIVHTGERNYKCTYPDCSKAFHHAENLKVHLRSHNNVNCPQCRRTFKEDASLQAHLKIHENSKNKSKKKKAKVKQGSDNKEQSDDQVGHAGQNTFDSPAKETAPESRSTKDKIDTSNKTDPQGCEPPTPRKDDGAKADADESKPDINSHDVYDFHDSDDEKVDIAAISMRQNPSKTPIIKAGVELLGSLPLPSAPELLPTAKALFKDEIEGKNKKKKAKKQNTAEENKAIGTKGNDVKAPDEATIKPKKKKPSKKKISEQENKLDDSTDANHEEPPAKAAKKSKKAPAKKAKDLPPEEECETSEGLKKTNVSPKKGKVTKKKKDDKSEEQEEEGSPKTQTVGKGSKKSKAAAKGKAKTEKPEENSQPKTKSPAKGNGKGGKGKSAEKIAKQEPVSTKPKKKRKSKGEVAEEKEASAATDTVDGEPKKKKAKSKKSTKKEEEPVSHNASEDQVPHAGPPPPVTLEQQHSPDSARQSDDHPESPAPSPTPDYLDDRMHGFFSPRPEKAPTETIFHSPSQPASKVAAANDHDSGVLESPISQITETEMALPSVPGQSPGCGGDNTDTHSDLVAGLSPTIKDISGHEDQMLNDIAKQVEEENARGSDMPPSNYNSDDMPPSNYNSSIHTTPPSVPPSQEVPVITSHTSRVLEDQNFGLPQYNREPPADLPRYGNDDLPRFEGNRQDMYRPHALGSNNMTQQQPQQQQQQQQLQPNNHPYLVDQQPLVQHSLPMEYNLQDGPHSVQSQHRHEGPHSVQSQHQDQSRTPRSDSPQPSIPASHKYYMDGTSGTFNQYHSHRVPSVPPPDTHMVPPSVPPQDLPPTPSSDSTPRYPEPMSHGGAPVASEPTQNRYPDQMSHGTYRQDSQGCPPYHRDPVTTTSFPSPPESSYLDQQHTPALVNSKDSSVPLQEPRERSSESVYLTNRTSDLSTSSGAETAAGQNLPVTSSGPSTTYSSETMPRDLFGQYFPDPTGSMPLTHPPISQEQRCSLPTYTPGQQSSLPSLPSTNSEYFRRPAAPPFIPGASGYPSVTDSLVPPPPPQHWSQEDRSRSHWGQPSPILPMPTELDSSSPLTRNPYSTSRVPTDYPSFNSVSTASSSSSSSATGQFNSKPAETTYPTTTSQTNVPAPERPTYEMASAYMSSRTFTPSYTGSMAPPAPASNTPKHLEEVYRRHMSDYRSLSQGPPPPPSMADMYSRMAVPPGLGLDKYYYQRDAMFRSQHLPAAPNPFMPQTSSGQMTYSDRDYTARNPIYSQHSAYGFMGDKQYLGSNKLPPTLPGLQERPMAAADYLQSPAAAAAAMGDPHMQDPYRRSVIYNMMSRYF